jgi:acetylornithine/succinyldiaminopimelate/putrescine aminotransferase
MEREVVLQREAMRVKTSKGWFVDTTGGQHSLLFCRPQSRSPEAFSLGVTELIGVNRFYTNADAIALEAWIANYDQSPDARSYFVSGGTEAFEAAISIAEHVATRIHGRLPGAVLGLTESYHGFSIGSLNAGDHPIHKRRVEGANGLQWPKIPRSAIRSPSSARQCLGELIENTNVTSVIIEPVGGTTSGAIAISDDVLAAMRDTCREHQVTFIVDEVVTGFGRVGPQFCVRGDDYDIRLSGKLLGGGMVPICAVMLSPGFSKMCDACELQPPLRFTYCGNSMTAKVALMLQRMRDVGEPLDVCKKGAYLRAGLNDRLAGFGVTVRGRGLLQAVAFQSANPAGALQRMSISARKVGVFVMGGYSMEEGTAHIMVTPPLDVTYDDLDITVEAIWKVFDTVGSDHE